MKSIIILISLFSSLAYPSSSTVKLKSLKPIHNAALEIGTMNVDLISAVNGKTIATLSSKLGDCADCTRGVSIHRDLGIRLEGSTLDSLKMTRKQTSKVKITSCPQNEGLRNEKFSCEFNYKGTPMKMVFSIVQ